MKKILFLLFVATMTNIQGIMAQEKITETVADGKAAFQREMIFPIGEPNPHTPSTSSATAIWLPYPRNRYRSAMSLSSRDAATTGTFTTPPKAAGRCWSA